MNDDAARPPVDGSARTAGLMFLLSLFVPMFGWLLVFARLIVPGDVVATGRNVAARGALFRAGIGAELLTALVVLGLAWALYALLEQVDRRLATLGLVFKLVEAALWGGASPWRTRRLWARWASRSPRVRSGPAASTRSSGSCSPST